MSKKSQKKNNFLVIFLPREPCSLSEFNFLLLGNTNGDLKHEAFFEELEKPIASL